MMERSWYLTISPSWHGLLGIQAAYLVKRFEEGKSHHQTKAQLLDARRVIAQKEAEIEKLKSQVSLKSFALNATGLRNLHSFRPPV